MNKTPRTDAQVSRYYDDATGERVEYVPARFCRQLERELGQRNAALHVQRDTILLLNKIARLNEHAGEIGHGMLVQIVTEARRLIGEESVRNKG